MITTIKEKDGYTLFRPMNTWDTNYHLVDNKGNDYLIDTCDVHDTLDDTEEYGGVTWKELSTLEDIEYIKDWAWKKIKADDSLVLRKSLDKITIL